MVGWLISQKRFKFVLYQCSALSAVGFLTDTAR
jgi:hypothetical protein